MLPDFWHNFLNKIVDLRCPKRRKDNYENTKTENIIENHPIQNNFS